MERKKMRPEDALRQWIVSSGQTDDHGEVRLLLTYLALLEKWNPRVNLTATTNWDELGSLFAEAIWAAGFYPKGPLAHLDIGSGAGFPAIPMRVMLPEMRLYMVESRTKRAAFLETVVTGLRLEGSRVICSRVEENLRSREAPPFDIVSWKGLRLSSDAFELLLAASGPKTQFWIFHGQELPLEAPERAGKVLTLARREHFPGRPGWQLSIYTVSRETHVPKTQPCEPQT
jgi:16S rRNA (guanine(527)-N(7))-methyltransferase RsmG